MDLKEELQRIRDEALKDSGLQWVGVVEEVLDRIDRYEHKQKSWSDLAIKDLNSQHERLDLLEVMPFAELSKDLTSLKNDVQFLLEWADSPPVTTATGSQGNEKPIPVPKKVSKARGDKKRPWPKCLEDNEPNRAWFAERRSAEFRSRYGVGGSDEFSKIKCTLPGCKDLLTKGQIFDGLIFHSRRCAASLANTSYKFKDIGRRMEDEGFTLTIDCGEGVRK